MSRNPRAAGWKEASPIIILGSYGLKGFAKTAIMTRREEYKGRGFTQKGEQFSCII